ncbi:MAG: ECF transporter S component [Atopobiaceae bacterium]|jgi:riboflavin transporter FmnP|nr:ECF transporter S component [Atopobiaceae bacterium]MCH4180312.1 ECF transporter S component [Atopobiaceae bacterium]MCH4214878.1 ECF transporter S component [Atopobiaceae bacterium]MCH4229315.1 ECF transporter S component [Atopobiaceae bacterium]MCH4276370.1 ECF transporter S component [Atopobiaceae bacterium]
MATNPSARPATHSTTGTIGGWNTRRIATCALFVAVAIVASFIELPIFPAAPYLKYDPSGIVCLVAGLAFGPATGALVCVLMWLPHLFVDPFGALMGIVAAVSLTVPTALVYQHIHTRRGAVIGMAVGAVVCLAACIGGNLVVTPLYSAVSVDQVAAMIVPILLPFNLLKIAINCVVTFLVYKSVSKLVGE